MSASVAGLPYAMQRIPVERSANARRHPRMNRLDKKLQVRDARVRRHAVSQVEDVAGTPARAAEHVPRAVADESGGAEQDRWIEVALHASRASDPVPAGVEGHAPVQR